MVAIATPSAPFFSTAPAVDRARPGTETAEAAAVARPGVVAVAGWLVATVVAVVALAFLVVQPASGVAVPEPERHVLAEGETLWSLAASRVPVGEADAYVKAIVALNGAVGPGSVVLLPAD